MNYSVLPYLGSQQTLQDLGNAEEETEQGEQGSHLVKSSDDFVFPDLCSSIFPSSLTDKDSLEQAMIQVCRKYNCVEARNLTGFGTLDVRPPIPFLEIGRLALESAAAKGKFFLTVQIGGMDGKSNDPMYEMFSATKPEILRHWAPVVFEPVPGNFKALTSHYQNEMTSKGLGCFVLARQAVTSDEIKDPNGCTFCSFDTSANAPESCQDAPEWMKLQIGSLKCYNLKNTFKAKAHCFNEAPIECNSVQNTLSSLGVASSFLAASMLQIDVEGFEKFLLPDLLNALPNSSHPPLIHFEQKVLASYNDLDFVVNFLIDKEYSLFLDGEDMLAFKTHVILQS